MEKSEAKTSVLVVDDDDIALEMIEHYLSLSCAGFSNQESVDAIMWPESMCSFYEPLVTFDPHSNLDSRMMDGARRSTNEFHRRLQDLLNRHRAVAAGGDKTKMPHFIVCSETIHLNQHLQRFNTVLFIDAEGKIVERYDKMHPVMFGEYVPLGTVLPWLYRMTPMGGGLTPGKGPVVFRLSGLNLSPSICFESTIPHLIRRHVVELTRRGTPPDVLVNLTNDGWFWGSSELDLHLACGVFRAVENRLPMLIAANNGFSASIGADGYIVQQGPRRDTAFIVSEIRSRTFKSPYRICGDVFAAVCLIFCTLIALAAAVQMIQRRRNYPSRVTS